MNTLIWPEIELVRDFMTVTATCKFEKDLIKNELAILRTTFSHCKSMGAIVCLFVLGFYGPVNNEVISSQSVNSGTVPGQA